MRKKDTWQGRLRRLAKQTKASATSILSKRMAAMKDMPCTYQGKESNHEIAEGHDNTKVIKSLTGI